MALPADRPIYRTRLMSETMSPDQLRVMIALFPKGAEDRQKLMSANGRLVHYTSAFAAINVLRRREVWMRKPQWMNDYRELEHGIECISFMYHKGPGGMVFKQALEAVVPGIVERVIKNFSDWLPHYRADTFVTCVSTHDEEEDVTGRMGMWTAHGKGNGVAMVLRSAPFTMISETLGAYSFPVSYRNREQVDDHFRRIGNNIPAVADLLKAMPVEQFERLLHEVFKYEMLCTKGHAFKDEREWRIVFTPDNKLGGRPYLVTTDVEFIDNAPQPVAKIPLDTHPGYDISIPTILDRVIVGPTKFPSAVIESFQIELERAGVKDARNKVFFADASLRV
jgi:hypothetical protein